MRVRLGVSLFSFVLACWPLAAQVCNGVDHPDERIIDCWNRLNPSSLNAPTLSALDTAAAERSTKDDLAKTNTGVPTISPALNTALRDFLALFSAAVSSSTLSQNGGNLTLDYNLSGGPLSPGNVTKLQAVFAKPALDKTLANQLTGKKDADAITNSLHDFDDVQLSATYAPTTVKVGRALEPHRWLLRAAMEAGQKAAPAPKQFLNLLALLQTLQDRPPFNSGDPLD